MNFPKYTSKSSQEILRLLKEEILILDGAMGTMIQKYPLTEEDFRGERFKDHNSPLILGKNMAGGLWL